MDDQRESPRSPAEDYPGPDPQGGPDVAEPGAAPAKDRAAVHAGDEDRAVVVGDAVAAFGPPLEQRDEPGTVMDTHEKRLRVESRDRIDSPPAVDPLRGGSEPPEPRFAISDHEAQTAPPPDPPGMPRPLSHDAAPATPGRAEGSEDAPPST
jgi:hypothetical protein